MKHEIFGELVFNTGWKSKKTLTMFNNNYSVNLKVQAYYEEDGITQEQEQAYKEYLSSESKLLEAAEKMLLEKDSMASDRFIPKTLLVNRDGSIAIMCDDEDEPDEGIAVCLMPEMQIMSQDDYL